MIEWREHLVCHPAICHGALCAEGTRVPVTVILDNLAEGAGREEIVHRCPTPFQALIDAALAHAAELAHEESLLPLHAA